MPSQMSLKLDCAQHLEDRFKDLRCAEFAFNWPYMPRERARLVEQLCHDIDILNEMLVQMRSQLNALAPVSCLPPEILGNVFSQAVELDPVSRDDLGWLRLTHVCHTWRRISLGMPVLWNRSLGREPVSAFATFFERAGDLVPLQFDLSSWQSRLSLDDDEDDEDGGGQCAIRALRDHSSRVQALNWTFDNSEGPVVHQILGRHAFDALRQMHLKVNLPHCDRIPRYNERSHPHIHFKIVSLRSLYFTSCFFPFDAPRLTSLTLCGDRSCVDPQQVRQALEGCPLLKCLAIYWKGRLSRQQPRDLPRVLLESLTRIDIGVGNTPIPSPTVIDAFLDYIEMPNVEHICIHGGPQTKELMNSAFLRTAFLTPVGDNEGISLVLSYYQMTMRVRTPLYRGCQGRTEVTSVSYNNVSGMNNQRASLMLGRCLAMNPVHHLTIDPHPDTNWSNIFQVMHRVQILEVTSLGRDEYHYGDPKPLIKALGTLLDTESEGSTPIAPLPELDTIVLRRSVTHHFVSMPDDVIPALQARINAGARPLQTLSVEGFEEDSVCAEILSGLVKNVVWRSA